MSALSFLNQNEYNTYSRTLAHHLGSIHAAIFLSELVQREEHHRDQYARDKGNGPLQFEEKEWWYYTHDQGIKRLAMSRKEQDTAIKILQENNLILKIQKGVPAKRYFWIDEDAVLDIFGFSKKHSRMTERGKLECPKGANSYIDKEPYKEPYKRNKSRNCVPLSKQTFGLVDFLYSEIQKNDSKAKPPNRDKWAVDIDRMHRIDKYTHKEIEELIIYSQEHEFWHTVVLSASKLRGKANQLRLCQKKANKKTSAETKDDREQENKKFTFQHFKDKTKYPLSKVRPGPEFVSLKIAGAWIEVRYDEHGFKEQLDKGLRHLEFER